MLPVVIRTCRQKYAGPYLAGYPPANSRRSGGQRITIPWPGPGLIVGRTMNNKLALNGTINPSAVRTEPSAEKFPQNPCNRFLETMSQEGREGIDLAGKPLRVGLAIEILSETVSYLFLTEEATSVLTGVR
ncbi:hypothetical protein Bbelb_231380 [Branchiostoma belcheri]|nr:hypothetical protein Bbelb_231380 [Branchiostoma belcheri]